MDQLLEFGIFAGKALIIVVGILAVVAVSAGLAMKGGQDKDHIEVTNLNKRFKKHASAVKNALRDKK